MTKDFHKIAIGSDHAGVTCKAQAMQVMQRLQYAVQDIGVTDEAAADYPDIAHKLAAMLTRGEVDAGILICGSGIGMSIAANRFPAVRAALCLTPEMATLSRQHNDANILVLGARLLSEAAIESCIEHFFTTSFEGGRHHHRVAKLSQPPISYEAKP